MQGYVTYELVFLGAMLVAILTTPIVTRVARAMRVLDQPDARKIHPSAIPRLGGAAIVFSVVALTLPILALDNTIGDAFREGQMQIVVLLASSIFMFAVGFIDDIKDLQARTKLLTQLLAALAVCASGVRIETFVMGGFSINLGWLSWPVTLLWIVGVTNALNFIDGLDGLAAGVSIIVCSVLAVWALYSDLPVMAVVMLAIVGSLMGFLFLNFNPARIFMGDSGSMFLGFLIASVSVRTAARSDTVIGLALPFMALGVPILDTILSFLRRMARRSLSSPDRQHIHHRLLEMGLRHRQASMLICLVTLILAGLGLFLIFLRGSAAMAVFGLGLVLVVLFFRAANALRLRETLRIIGQNIRIARGARQQQEHLARAELSFRNVMTFEAWWSAVCEAAESFGALRLEMRIPDLDGSQKLMSWQRDGIDENPGEVIRIDLPIRQRREVESLRMIVRMHVGDSIELAGCRATCFARLLDKHGITELAPPEAGDRGDEPRAESGIPVGSDFSASPPQAAARI